MPPRPRWSQLGAFPGYKKNREHMLRVIRNHRRAAHGERSGYEKVATPPGAAFDHKVCPDQRFTRTPNAPGTARFRSGSEHGFRNAQVSVIAPTGTIALGDGLRYHRIEPDFALVKFKKLAGGGYFKIINRACRRRCACSAMGKHRSPRSKPMRSATARSARRPASITRPSRPRVFSPEAIERVEKALPTAFRHQVRLQQMDLGRGILPRRARHRGARPRFGELRPASPTIGFTRREIDAANIHVCGAMTVDGAGDEGLGGGEHADVALDREIALAGAPARVGAVKNTA